MNYLSSYMYKILLNQIDEMQIVSNYRNDCPKILHVKSAIFNIKNNL